MLAGSVEIELGRFDDARLHLDRALGLARRIGAGNFEAQSLRLLGRLAAAEGRKGDAQKLLDQATNVVRTVGMTFIGPTVLAQRAAVSDDPVERKSSLAEAEGILNAGCVSHNHFWFAETAIDQCLASHEWDAAEHYANRLEDYIRAERLAWPEFTIARARALVAWGRGRREPALTADLEKLRGVAAAVGLVQVEAALARTIPTS
jgi:tetratricopeptide (TPR) repeat protein